MFFHKRDKEWLECQKRLSDFDNKFSQIYNDMKILRENLDKVEIKALESQKVYKRKLKNLLGDEENKTENNLKPNVFLSPNGTPI